MLTSLLLAALLTPSTLAQVQTTPVQPPPVAVAPVVLLNNGPCLDSPRSVPQVLAPPVVRATQIVRIDKVVSTATMTQGETIGFLYTLQDGSTWLGQRTSDYVSSAQATQINQVLASTHSSDTAIKAFPPATRLGIATKFQQYFKVSIPPDAAGALKIEIDPCVAWPSGLALPDPSM
jgi:hypothetical protein